MTAGLAANQISLHATLVVVLSDQGGILAAWRGAKKINLEKIFFFPAFRCG